MDHCKATALAIGQHRDNALSMLVNPRFLYIVHHGEFDFRLRQRRNVEDSTVSHPSINAVLSKGRGPHDTIQRCRVVLRGVVEPVAGNAKKVRHNRLLRGWLAGEHYSFAARGM